MSQCFAALREMMEKVKQGEKLVLLLIEHGGLSVDGQFQFLITQATKPNMRSGEAYIMKDQLEVLLKPCQGDVLIICNSCFSGGLISEHWALLCSATPEISSDTLSQSGSGYFRGWVFTACLVAQVAREYGLLVPLPQADPRTWNNLE
jgi:hypothetical protein